MFQTVIGHLYAGARAYPYVLTQRCNDISFSQVAILAGFNHVCVCLLGFWRKGLWSDSSGRIAMLLPVTFDLIYFLWKSFLKGCLRRNFFFGRAVPYKVRVGLFLLWISTLVLLFCKQTNCLMWKCLQFWFNIQFCVFLFTLGFFSAKQCCKCGQTLQGSATLMEIHNRWFQASKRCSLEINDQCNALVTILLFCQHFCFH